MTTHRNRLGSDRWKELCDLGKKEVLPAGRRLFHQGDSASHVWALCEGAVFIGLSNDEGKQYLLSLRGAGELLGELALFGDGIRSATVTTATKSTLARLGKDEFLQFVKLHDLNGVLLQHTIATLNETDALLLERATCRVPQRLARALVRWKDAVAVPQRPKEPTPPLTQRQLADLIGAHFNFVNRTLVDWAKEGIVSTKPRLTVLRWDRLRSIAALSAIPPQR